MSDNDNKMLWGRCTWILFHVLAARINEKSYPSLKGEILGIINQVCKNLPCPDCASHATNFINIVKLQTVPTKQLLKSMLFQFHNQVNRRLNKRQFTLKELEVYDRYNLGIAIQNFLTFYAKRYNGTLQAGIQSTELRRRRIAISVHEWFKKNWHHFN